VAIGETAGAEVTSTTVDLSASGPTGPGGEVPERRLTDSLDRLVKGRWGLAEAVLYVVCAVTAWGARFVQDDAFITYRYARNLARGNGLVFNEGEKVEGYTNFLWTAMHWLPEKLGWSTPIFSQLVGIAMMLATVAVTIRLARRIFASPSFAFLVALTLVANVTFLTYATGGLETMQQTLLVVSVAALLLPVTAALPPTTWRRLGAGVCGGLAVLTRLDSALLVGTIIVVHLVMTWRLDRDGSPAAGPGEADLAGEVGQGGGPDAGAAAAAHSPVATVLAAAVQIGVPIAVLVFPWLAWKLAYYGEIVPNTFFAKSAGNPIVPPLYGIFYIVCFFISYAAFLFIGRFRRLRHELFAVPGVAQALVVVPVWFVYICVVGGDFMEFRFMVPIIPVLAIVAAFLVNRFRSVRKEVLLIAVLLVFSGVHRIAPTVLPYPVLTFTQLNHWPNESATTWKGKGELLAEEFPGGPDVEGQPTLAVAPLGVLPYFADLTTIDMLGLTDAYIARNGYSIEPYYPGHVRMAPVDYLVERGVNLVLAQPGSVEHEAGRESYRLSELTFLWPSVDLRDLPADAQVIEIPQVDGRDWLIVYLEQNDKVDEVIERNDWRVLPIDHECRESDLDLTTGPMSGLVNSLARLISERTCPEL
jgi:arabinofuranosyltransferase